MAEFLALDWDEHSVRGMVADVSTGKLQIRKQFHAERPDTPGKEPWSWIRQALVELGHPGISVIVSLPRERVVMRRLDLPDVPDEELPTLVRFQAAAKSSVPLTDLFLDYLPLPKQPNAPGRTVLVATIAKGMIEEIQAAVAASEMKLVSIGLNPVATAELVARSAMAERPVPLLTIARSGIRLEVCLFERGKLLFAHAGRLPGESEAQDNAALMAEVSRVLINARGFTSSEKIGEFYLLGGDSEFPGLPSAIKARFGADVEIVDPRSVINVKGELPEASPLIGILGALLACDSARAATFDFLNPRKAEVKPDLRKQRLTMAGTGAAAVVLLGLVSYFWYLSSLDAAIEDRAQQLQLLASDIKKGETELQAYNTVAKWEANRMQWLDEMLEVTRHVQDNNKMYFSSWRFEPPVRNNPATMRAEGYARERPNVVELNNRLLTDAPRYQIKPHSIRTTTRDGYYPWHFEAELLIDANPKAKSAAQTGTKKL